MTPQTPHETPPTVAGLLNRVTAEARAHGKPFMLPPSHPTTVDLPHRPGPTGLTVSEVPR